MRHAPVGPLGPRVGRRVRVQVEPDVTELIDPTKQVAILVRVPCALAAAHGDAHHVARSDLCDGSQCGDFAIVDDLEWDIACNLLCQPLEDVDNLGLVDIRGDVWEYVAPSG